MTIVEEKPLKADEAIRNAPGGRWELVGGKVVRAMPVQPEHGVCVQEIGRIVGDFVGVRNALMGPEIGFITTRNPDTVRAPDWSLIPREAARARPRGPWIAGGPDLAVEVVSPDDPWNEVQEKVDEYLAAGTKLVWIVEPLMRRVHVIRPDGPEVTLGPGEILTVEPVVPGLTLPVDALFAGLDSME